VHGVVHPPCRACLEGHLCPIPLLHLQSFRKPPHEMLLSRVEFVCVASRTAWIWVRCRRTRQIELVLISFPPPTTTFRSVIAGKGVPLYRHRRVPHGIFRPFPHFFCPPPPPFYKVVSSSWNIIRAPELWSATPSTFFAIATFDRWRMLSLAFFPHPPNINPLCWRRFLLFDPAGLPSLCFSSRSDFFQKDWYPHPLAFFVSPKSHATQFV